MQNLKDSPEGEGFRPILVTTIVLLPLLRNEVADPQNGQGRPIMAILHGMGIFSCALVIAAALLAAEAAAEAVQVSMTVDANTTALYRFREGSGATSANDVPGGKPINVGKATWVPGRQYFALATDTGKESDASYAYVVDDASNHPRAAMTVEAWVKLNYTNGYLVCKNGIFFITLGDGVAGASFTVDGNSYAVNGVLPLPIRQWFHLAVTYQQNQLHDGNRSDLRQRRPRYADAVHGDDHRSDEQRLRREIYHRQQRLDRPRAPKWTARSTRCASRRSPAFSRRSIPRRLEPTTPPGNLVPNGDFEIGLTGWRPDDYGDINLVWETTGGAASGQKCLHSLAARNPQAGVYSRPIPACPGRRYTFSGRFKYISSPRANLLSTL